MKETTLAQRFAEKFCTPDCTLQKGKVEHSVNCSYSKGLKSVILTLADEHAKDGSIIPLADAIEKLLLSFIQAELLLLAGESEAEIVNPDTKDSFERGVNSGLRQSAALIRKRAELN